MLLYHQLLIKRPHYCATNTLTLLYSYHQLITLTLLYLLHHKYAHAIAPTNKLLDLLHHKVAHAIVPPIRSHYCTTKSPLGLGDRFIDLQSLLSLADSNANIWAVCPVIREGGRGGGRGAVREGGGVRMCVCVSECVREWESVVDQKGYRIRSIERGVFCYHVTHSPLHSLQ